MQHLVTVLIGLGAVALLGAWQLWRQVPQEEYVLLAEDARLARLSEHCKAEVLFPEENRDLHSAIVVMSHGEVSPLKGWPDDPQAPTWDCRPADLPRHWRINSRVRFQAVAEDGQLLERSFDPDFDSSADDVDEPWAGQSCAKDQLTSDGFKQAVLNGRRLQGRYGEALAAASLEVHSLDYKPSLATAVGTLLPLLPDLEKTVSITAIPPEAEVPGRESEDVLARWCHAGSLPCNDWSCMTPAAVEKQLEAAEAAAGTSPRWLASLQRWLRSEKRRFALLSLDTAQLGLLSTRLGLSAKLPRPPRGSLLVLERSMEREGRWRVLWNGQEVTMPCDLRCTADDLLKVFE